MKKRIIISPWSKNTPKGQVCAKNYPFWPELVELLNNKYDVIQIGRTPEEKIPNCSEYLFDKPLKDIKNLLFEVRDWISVDNFFHHFARFYKINGTVIFAKSDPAIFGHKHNNNLLKSKSFLRKDQFLYWNDEPLDKNSFLSAQEVYKSVITFTG